MTAICVIGTETVGAFPGRVDPRSGGGAAGLRRRGDLTRGRRDQRARVDHPVDLLAQPVRRRRGGPDRRPAAGGVRLLGLGVGGQPQRGDRGLRVDAGQGRDRLDRRAAGDLPVGGLRGGRLRGRRLPDRERQDEEERSSRVLGRRGDGRLVLGGAAGGLHLGDRLDPDHDHPGVPDRAVDGPAGALPKAWRTSTRGSAPRTSPPGLVAVDRDRLVPGGQLHQRERAVRLADRAVAADRLLLRAHRHRLRHLLPPRTAPRA